MKDKLIYLGNAANIHTKRWAMHFSHSYTIIILSFEYAQIDNVQVIKLDSPIFNGLLRYLWVVPKVIKLLNEFNPKIVHAHYAGGYGLLAALSGFHPYVLSVWGSDIYQAPRASFFNQLVLKYILGSADYLCSTSISMSMEASKYTDRDFVITPFGIDCDLYCPNDQLRPQEVIVIGTVKKLDRLYGVDRLIKAFALIKYVLPRENLRLLIVGDGDDREQLLSLVSSLGISHCVEFTGMAHQDDVPGILNRMSIYVALSRSESFGVAVLEASACGLPVVVSDAGGLPEVVCDGVTGFIIPNGDPEAASEAIAQLVTDRDLRNSMGFAGREFVMSYFQWKNCVRKMEELYANIKNGYERYAN
ncbi:MAG: glycosyltransferase [Sulfurimonas sp.]|nr:glycosyltransferase [Sulfurimonas sp.]